MRHPRFEPVHWITLACVVVLAFVITDCSAGRTAIVASKVVGHHYEPARDWTQTTTDAHGYIHVTQHHEDEQFHIIFENRMEVDVSRGVYYSVEQGRQYFIAYRGGRWTGWCYFSRIRFDLDTNGPVEVGK